MLPILHLNGYKIANPTLLARIRPRGAREPARRLRLQAVLRRGLRSVGGAPRRWRRRSTTVLDEIAAIQREARENGAVERPAVADDRPPHAEGLDGAEGGRRQEDRGLLALAPGAVLRARRRTRAPHAARGVAQELQARGAVRRGRAAHGRSCASSPRPASGAWARTRTRTAASCSATCGCRTSATTRSRCRRRGVDPPRGDEGARQLPPRRDEARTRRRGTSSSSRPTSCASNRLGALFEVTEPHAGSPSGCRRTTTSRPTAACWRSSASTRARAGSRATSSPAGTGIFTTYEAFVHIVDSMFNQHAKWLKVTRERDPVAPADRVAQLPAHLARVAPGPQRLLAPGPRLHRPRREQEGRGDRRLPAAGREHAALRHGRRACASREHRQRRRRRQAARAPVPRHGRRDQALHDRDRHLGVGVERPRLRAGRRDGVLRRRPDDRDARRGRPPAQPLPRPQGARRSTSST